MERNSLPVVSPSLIYHGNYSEPAPEGFKRFSCIYLMICRVETRSLNADEIKDEIDEFKDWLLIQPSQMYEKSRAENAREEAIDKFLLTASQEVKAS